MPFASTWIEIKGGGLAAAAYPAKCLSLVLSDVPGNRLDVIASGPTVPDPSTFSDALAVLNKYNLTERVPDTIIPTPTGRESRDG